MFEYATSFNGDVTAWDVRSAGTVETCTTDMYGYTYCYTGSMINMFSGMTAFNAMFEKWQIGKRRRIVHAFEHALRTELQVPERSRRTAIGVLCDAVHIRLQIGASRYACFDEAFDGDCQCVQQVRRGGFTDIEMEHDWDDLHAKFVL